MELAAWKSELPPVFSSLCTGMLVEDVWIDWIDIIFEQIGNASGCPPHTHTWYEFNYVMSGETVTHFDGRAVTLQEGDFFLIPPGMIHSHTYRRGNPHEGLCLRWRIRPGGTVLDQAGNATEATGSNPAHPASFYRRLDGLKEWKPGGYHDHYGIREQLLRFLRAAMSPSSSALYLKLMLTGVLESLTAIPFPDKQVSPKQGESKDTLIKKVEVYLEDFTGDRLNVEELASSMHMSYGHLSRLYKERTGMTLVERMNQLRLEKARALLAQPDMLIREAAWQAGFADIYYFSKAFKRAYGISPKEYRSQLTPPHSPLCR